MIAALVTLSLAGLTWQTPPSLVQKHFSRPTGANAFEEYLAAADIVARTDFRLYKTWFDYRASKDRGSEWDKVPPIPPGLSAESTPLDIRREVARRFGRVVDLIHAGNSKPANPFRSTIDIDTTFEEYAQYKSAAWVLDCSAYVAFAEGASGRGVGILLDQLSFATAISSETLIAYLVGRAIQAVALARFETQLPLLSVADAARIERYCKGYLEQPEPFIACVEGEKKFMLQSVAKVLESESGLLSFGAEEQKLEKALKALAAAPADKQKVAQLLARKLELAYEAVLNRYRGPERDWIGKVESDQIVPTEIISHEDLADYLVEVSMPVWDAAAQAALRNRCQLRLLRLHAKIIEHRWRHERLPTRLGDAVSEEDILDPINGQQFQYELREGGYRLYSKGIAQTGEIELRYRRPLPTEDEGGRPPP